jgi:hypothetical protein
VRYQLFARAGDAVSQHVQVGDPRDTPRRGGASGCARGAPNSSSTGSASGGRFRVIGTSVGLRAPGGWRRTIRSSCRPVIGRRTVDHDMRGWRLHLGVVDLSGAQLRAANLHDADASRARISRVPPIAARRSGQRASTREPPEPVWEQLNSSLHESNPHMTRRCERAAGKERTHSHQNYG